MIIMLSINPFSLRIEETRWVKRDAGECALQTCLIDLIAHADYTMYGHRIWTKVVSLVSRDRIWVEVIIYVKAISIYRRRWLILRNRLKGIVHEDVIRRLVMSAREGEELHKIRVAEWQRRSIELDIRPF